MTGTRRLLVLASAALLVVGVLADWYAVAHHLPYAVGGHGAPDSVGRDWPANGTALGPPLAPMIALVIGAGLVPARRWWGAVGSALLALVALAELVGTVAEPSFRHVFTADGFDAVQVLLRLATLAAAAVILAGALLDLRLRWAGRRSSARDDALHARQGLS